MLMIRKIVRNGSKEMELHKRRCMKQAIWYKNVDRQRRDREDVYKK